MPRAVTKVSTSVRGWDLVAAEINAAYGDFRFGSTRREPRFHQEALGDDALFFSRAELMTSVRSATANYTAPTVVSVLAGSFTVRGTATAMPSPERGTFLMAGDHHVFHIEADDARALIVQLSPAELHAAAGALAVGGLIVPETLPALPPHAAARWWRAAAEAKRIYESDELYRSYLVKRTAQRRLHDIALDAFHLLPATGTTITSERVVATAKRFIDENIDTPLTATTIASAVHVSVRGLQAAFERAGEQSPMRYAKKARLDAARHDLTHADPSTTTVQDVALRWGFTSLGRFSGDYRAAFGALPRDTLAA